MELPFGAKTPFLDYINALTPDPVPLKVREYALSHNVPSLNELGAKFLFFLTTLLQPKSIIDIGCGIGASTIALAKGAPLASVTAIDANRERAEECLKLTAERPSVRVHNTLAEEFLKNDTNFYDFAFIDSIKKEYALVWRLLKPRMAKGGMAVFDDVLLHGYTALEEEETPVKYRGGRALLRQFLEGMCAQGGLLLPIGGGMLLYRVKS